MTTRWNLIENRPRDEAGRVAITLRQRQVIDAIRMMTRRRGYPPTVREVQEAFGWRSPNVVAQHLRLLRRKGWVTWVEGQSRTLTIVGE